MKSRSFNSGRKAKPTQCLQQKKHLFIVRSIKTEIENHGEVIIYTSNDGSTKINVNLQDETVWLSLDQMAELFQRDKSTISWHIKNVFSEGELQAHSLVANFATTAADGKIYQVDHYNLDVITSVGCRVKSLQGTQFRIWANSVLKNI